jgi:hypothetical protein
VAVFLYALVRVGRYHPAGQGSYMRWVSSTPWRASRPLPLGPPYLVWEDAVPALVVWTLCSQPIIPFTFFAMIYGLKAMALSMRGRDGGWFSALFMCLAAGEFLAWPSVPFVLTIGLAILVGADRVIRRSLFDIPWTSPVAAEARAMRARLEMSNWPLAPLTPKPPISLLRGWVTSVVLAWIAYCLATRAIWDDPSNRDAAATLVTLILVVAPLFRWATYCAKFQPPISSWGRLWTGRLIIPGYDYVLIAPLAATMIGGGLPAACWILGYQSPLALAIAVLSVMSILLNAGPTLSHWQLTGHHRIISKQQRPRRQGTRGDLSLDGMQ